MTLTKETFTGETYLKEQLEILRKYVYNVVQRHQEEYREQRMQGVPNAMTAMGNLVDEIVKKRERECDEFNHKYGEGDKNDAINPRRDTSTTAP